ncbi:mRNA interferase MazF [Arboricoccus pini]|uniref:mRNA interferase MazF n=1 Tax=Arboricoccus pini TaxID=1963835 RepID=A0A212RFN7_9PROT|nr:type II toxin-antitoxin system PemK/MazF family toxin [Arboricoccus pini]SNB71142.1 mRNA interferase MazF [Arboricoccus pini]
MKRGDVVIVALAGELGKPRPAIVVQSDLLNDADPQSFLVAPLTTSLESAGYFRPMVEPTARNGLDAPSAVMTDKIIAVPVRRLRDVIGALDPDAQRAVDSALLLALGLAE